jgi:hypothetical protein
LVSMMSLPSMVKVAEAIIGMGESDFSVVKIELSQLAIGKSGSVLGHDFSLPHTTRGNDRRH